MELNQTDLIRNYFTIGIRNLLKRKVYSFITIFGLAIGIAACLVIWKYVDFELSYDWFHKDADNKYRIASSLYSEGGEPFTGYDLAPALLNELPEIKSCVRTHGFGEAFVSYHSPAGKEVSFEEKDILIVDSTFLDFFSFNVVRGDPTTALDKPSSLVITETIAERYFGRETDPVGKTIHLSKGWADGDYQVTAVLKDLPQNSNFSFSMLSSMHNLLHTDFYRNGRNAHWNNFFTYIELFQNADRVNLEAKIPSFIARYTSYDKNLNSHRPQLRLQPIRQIHFSPDFVNPEGNHYKIYFLLLISAFILFMAWTNYVNLSTARATERAKEVGIKKTIGVQERQLRWQFMFESLIINLLGILVAVGLSLLLLPVLGDIIDKKLSIDFNDLNVWLLLFFLLLAGTGVSGFYPAFILSSVRTIDVLKGAAKVKGRPSLRRSLVLFQFASSLILIAGTFAVYNQIYFMKNHEKGFDMNQMLIVKAPRKDPKRLEERLISYKDQLQQFSFVNHVASSLVVPGGSYNWGTLMRREGTPKEENKNGYAIWVDPDFIETYGMKLVSGKVWNRWMASDMKSVLINEASIIPFGLGDAEKALTSKIIIKGTDDDKGADTVAILGVLKNYHWSSLKEEYSPIVMIPQKISGGLFSIQLTTQGIHESIEKIREQYQLHFPDEAFTYFFLDDFYNKQYREDEQFEKIFSLFAILAIAIACLGLWGLTSFTTLQRIKEIGIRKVLGASVKNIMVLLSRQYLNLILMASLIASPIAWYAIHVWLRNFAYRISLSWELFAVPVLILCVLTFITISVHITRAVLANPVESLKSE